MKRNRKIQHKKVIRKARKDLDRSNASLVATSLVGMGLEDNCTDNSHDHKAIGISDVMAGGQDSTIQKQTVKNRMIQQNRNQTFSPWIANRVDSTRNSGTLLSDQTRSFMESRFGADFGQVRIHSGNDAVQLNRELGADAFTSGKDIFFNKGKYAPESASGKNLLAHELTHVLQQKGKSETIQRKLTVEDEYPQKYIDLWLTDPKGKDKSKNLSDAERLEYVTVLLRMLSPHFNVGGGGVVESSGKKETELVKDSKATASCCMHILTRNNNTDWKILVADHLSPHTLEEESSILISSELSPVKYGAHTSSGKKHSYDKGQIILGHEMCGHAALIELGAHPEGKRAVTNVHDPTVKIENEIAKEQGEKEENLRGMANSGVHRGESFGQMVIERFALNIGSIHSLPSSEQNKMKMLADMISRFDMFVELHGHSDNLGSEAAKMEVSVRRANKAQEFLDQMGVSDTAEVSVSKDKDAKKIPVHRFVKKGLSDKEPPEGVDPTQQDRFRRVEVTVAGFPWALSELPKGITKDQLKRMELKDKTKDTFEKPDKVEKLRTGGTPCEKLLIGKAY